MSLAVQRKAKAYGTQSGICSSKKSEDLNLEGRKWDDTTTKNLMEEKIITGSLMSEMQELWRVYLPHVVWMKSFFENLEAHIF